MKIKLKLVLLFLGVSLIPFILVSIIYINGSKNMLKESINTSFERVAKEKANSIDSIITNRVAEVELLAETPEIKDLIKESNSSYEGRNTKEVMNEIIAIDESWIKSKETNEDANRILNNEVSILLKEYKNRNSEKYGEIFVSDKNGAAVAMTKTLSDYYQADEQWWGNAFNDGEGEVFIDDRGFDSSVGALVIGVVVPVKESGKVIGVLKINYKIKEIINIIGEPLGETDFIILARSQGDIIASSLGAENIEKLELEQSIKSLEKNLAIESTRMKKGSIL